MILVFHIGSSFVGGAFFLTQKSGIPKIVFSIREPIALEENIEADRFLSLTMKSLEIVVHRIHKAGIGAPKEIFCVLSSLWHVSQTRIIKLEKNTPFLFTEKLALELIKKEQTLFEEEYSAKYSHPGVKTRLIELKNIKVMLNGYETPKPLNQKGSDLEMTVFIGMSDEEILGKIEKTIMEHFSFKKINFSSFTFSSFAVVRDMHMRGGDFLLISVGGEATSISMVKKNILHESICFPLGLNFITRQVASLSGSSLDEAESLVSLFKDGHATKPVEKKISPIIDKSKAEWLHKFQESLANLSNDISVPATIYLVVDKEMADFFSETIKSEQFNQYTLTESKFDVIFLGAKVLHELAQFEEDAIRDPFLVIDSIYINRFITNPANPTKRGEIARI